MDGNKGCIDQEDSRRITSLRFLLIVLVIFVHNNGQTAENTAVVFGVKTVVSEMIARAAVPLFFFVSGWLLFMKPVDYRTNLRKKARTLLVPYLFWNSAVLAALFVGQNTPGLSRFFQDENNRITGYSLYQWADAYLGLNYEGYPAAYQMWFIRDLMLLMLLYPLGKWIVDRAPAAALGGMLFLWLTQRRMLFFSSEAALFFFLGYYAVKYKWSFGLVDRLKYRDLVPGYVICMAAELWLLLSGQEFMILQKLGILSGCLFWLKLSGRLAGAPRLYPALEKLAGYAFFVYASHEPLMMLLRKAAGLLLPYDTTAAQLAQYFGLIALTVLLCLAAGWCFKKIWPKGYALVTGGRG